MLFGRESLRMISIIDPVLSTIVFTALLVCGLLITVRKKTSTRLFPVELTEELKGFAILIIIFSHIGYILSSDHSFLWPLSTMAGVGVNLFLFLSGYGLSLSALKKAPKLKTYARRILQLFIPLWVVISLYFVLDYFVLHISYTAGYVAHSLAGIFLRADALQDVNSVLWFLSLILFYYLLFPLAFMKKRLWASALIVFVVASAIVWLHLDSLRDVMRFYQVHTAAFPLGILAAWLTTTRATETVAQWRASYTKFRLSNQRGKLWDALLYGVTSLILIGAISYVAINSSVDSTIPKEQTISLLTMFLVIALFIHKRIRFGLLAIFGYVSFEIYLLHWPLISRYDFLYSHVPAWLATALYLVIFVALGWLLKLITNWFLSRGSSKNL